jgi:hypothetical protein
MLGRLFIEKRAKSKLSYKTFRFSGYIGKVLHNLQHLADSGNCLPESKESRVKSNMQIAKEAGICSRKNKNGNSQCLTGFATAAAKS